MHKVDHAYFIWSTWWLHRSATDESSTACVINLQSIFVYNLDLSNFLLKSRLWYFLFLSILLLLVYFVSAAGCHCLDLTQQCVIFASKALFPRIWILIIPFYPKKVSSDWDSTHKYLDRLPILFTRSQIQFLS